MRTVERNELVLAHLGLVKAIAVKLLPRMRGADLDDLIQDGVLGLIAACEHFDRCKGRFASYAYYRIRGAMLDGHYAQRGGRSKFLPEQMVSLSTEVAPGVELGEVLEAPENVEDEVIANSLRDEFDAKLTSGLNRNQERVIRGHFYEDLPLKVISKKIGVSDCRASQLKTEAVNKLRFLMRGQRLAA